MIIFLCVLHMALIVCTRAFILKVSQMLDTLPALLTCWWIASVVWSRSFRLRGEQRPPSVHFLLHRGRSQAADLFMVFALSTRRVR